MIFDSNGLPKDNGAADRMDSCRLAGLLATFNHSEAPDMRKYLLNGQGVRHPTEFPSNNPLNFTRDQLMCLVSGLHKQERYSECEVLLNAAKARGNRAQNSEADAPGSTKKWPNGADYLSPSHMNHLKICSGQKSTLLGKVWLIMDIMFQSYFSPKSEPNQLMCMCSTAGQWYVDLFRKHNKDLSQAISDYWAGWRDESLLGQFLDNSFR